MHSVFRIKFGVRGNEPPIRAVSSHKYLNAMRHAEYSMQDTDTSEPTESVDTWRFRLPFVQKIEITMVTILPPESQGPGGLIAHAFSCDAGFLMEKNIN